MKCEPWRRCEDEAIVILRAAGADSAFIIEWCREIYGTRRTVAALSERVRRRLRELPQQQLSVARWSVLPSLTPVPMSRRRAGR